MPVALEQVAHVDRDYAFNEYRNSAGSQDFGGLEFTLADFEIGGAEYPLRFPLLARYYRSIEKLIVDSVSPVFIGSGPSTDVALTDFKEQVHFAIQDLIGKRPFEFSDTEKIKWQLLNELFDLTVYQNTTPIQVRQFGKIKKGRPTPQSIEWETGRIESVTMDQVLSPEFVTFKVGQPIEAIVERDRISNELLRILFVSRCKQFSMSKVDEDGLWSRIGSTGRLPQDPDWKP